MTSPPTPDAGRDFAPTASWANLRLRAEMLRRLRRFFENSNFLEVETPILSADSVVDRYLDPLRTTVFDDPCHPNLGRTCWLQTSPEFGMKRLLAAGAPSIYQVTKAFRGGGEFGPHHNPEFTMVEWYGVGDSYEMGIQRLSDLAALLLHGATPEKISYRSAFETHLALDPHQADVATMRRVCHDRGITPPASLDPHDRDQWLNLLLATCIEPQLGLHRPTILYDYPASQAALAQVRAGDPPCAERFELYVHGVELANGYHELLDPAVLRQRNQRTNAQRVADGKFTLPEESQLLAAMEHGLPSCTGVALGFDRMVMLAANARQIADVITFPIDRA